jgi:glycosyltransferase involved in cell wall biosynthesis
VKVALLVPGGVDRSGTHRVIPCLLWLIERLARAVELHVFALKQEPRPARWPLLGAQVHNIGARPRSVRTLAAVAAEHRRAPFDVLHAVWATPGAVAATVGSTLRIPVLLHVTGGDLVALPELHFGLRSTMRGRIQLRIAVAGADRVTTPSAAMVQAAARLGVTAERLHLGVALDRWPPAPPRPRDPLRPARLLQIASLNLVKDQQTLLEAARRLLEWGRPFRLDVVGQDTLGQQVQRAASRMGLDGCVRFHGFLPHTTLRTFVDASDLLVVSSRHEADPTALLEAAVAGVPTVGTAVGHLLEWAPDAAVAVPVGDPRALAEAILGLLANESRRIAVARAAQAKAVREDADWSAARVLRIYDELAGPRRSSTWSSRSRSTGNAASG